MTMCSIAGCGDQSRKRGWCSFHYDRWLRNGHPLAGGPRRLPPNSLTVCSVDGCGLKARARNLCAKHYTKLMKHGDVNGGYVQDGRSKEWHTRKGGYVIKFDRQNKHSNKTTGIVFQHRYVMGEFLGRALRRNENVHHINGDRSDNKIENLELWVKSQPAGQRIHDLVDWAEQILETYSKENQTLLKELRHE